MALFAESQIISAIHIVTKNNDQNRYTCAHNNDKIVAIDNHVRWCFYRLLIQIKHIMLDNKEASIRVWNKYIDDPNPNGVKQKIACDIYNINRRAFEKLLTPLKIEPARFKRQCRKVFFGSTPFGGTIKNCLLRKPKFPRQGGFQLPPGVGKLISTNHLNTKPQI